MSRAIPGYPANMCRDIPSYPILYRVILRRDIPGYPRISQDKILVLGYPITSFLFWVIPGYPGINTMSGYPGISLDNPSCRFSRYISAKLLYLQTAVSAKRLYLRSGCIGEGACVGRDQDGKGSGWERKRKDRSPSSTRSWRAMSAEQKN